MTKPTSVTPRFWEEWAGVTRFLESTRLAFARETNLWTGLELDAPPEEVRISVNAGKGRFRVALDQHLATLGDQTILHASVLIHSYALAESAGAIKLGVDTRELRGIEDWGSQLLELNSRTWNKVHGGRAGAVEVAVIRNAFAHGTRRIDGLGSRRLADHGMPRGTLDRPCPCLMTMCASTETDYEASCETPSSRLARQVDIGPAGAGCRPPYAAQRHERARRYSVESVSSAGQGGPFRSKPTNLDGVPTPVRKLIAHVPAPGRDHREDEPTTLLEQILVETTVLLAYFVRHVSNVELDGATAARLEVDEEQPFRCAQEISRMRLAVQELVGARVRADCFDWRC